MGALDVRETVGAAREGRAARPGRARCFAALLPAIVVLVGLVIAVPAGAAPAGDASGTVMARLALGQAELYAWDAGAGDWLGWSVALSGDTAVVGAPFHDTSGKSNAGAAYVFTRTGGVWTAPLQLAAGDGAAGDQFGSSVAVSGDTALVGAQMHGTGGTAAAGAAYVFTRSGGSWTQQAKLTALVPAAYDFFGEVVALSSDTALVGASNHTVVGADGAGAAYVFTRSGGSWTQQQRLTAAAPAAGDLFGDAVALSGDTALVGAPYHDAAGAPEVGAAYVFTRSGGSWTQQAELSASDAAGQDQFGVAVALSGDTALVGALNHDSGGVENAGAAYVFTRSGASWTQQATLTAADGAAQDDLGFSVALSGERALVGSFGHDATGLEHAGAAYVFTRSGGSWTQQATLTAVDGAAEDWFGVSVALSGGTALVGAPFHDTARKSVSGAAYAFITAPLVSSFSPAAGPVGASVTISGSGFADAVAVAFNGVPAVFHVGSDALITAVVPAGAASGPITVTAAGGTGAGAASFAVTRPPAIIGLKPASGRRSSTVTVTGTGFGAVRGGGAVRFGGTACTKYVSWSDTRITCKVPAKARLGTVKVTVTTAGGVSNARSFRVKR
jgi:hypothetical protein